MGACWDAGGAVDRELIGCCWDAGGVVDPESVLGGCWEAVGAVDWELVVDGCWDVGALVGRESVGGGVSFCEVGGCPPAGAARNTTIANDVRKSPRVADFTDE